MVLNLKFAAFMLLLFIVSFIATIGSSSKSTIKKLEKHLDELEQLSTPEATFEAAKSWLISRGDEKGVKKRRVADRIMKQLEIVERFVLSNLGENKCHWAPFNDMRLKHQSLYKRLNKDGKLGKALTVYFGKHLNECTNEFQNYLEGGGEKKKTSMLFEPEIDRYVLSLADKTCKKDKSSPIVWQYKCINERKGKVKLLNKNLAPIEQCKRWGSTRLDKHNLRRDVLYMISWLISANNGQIPDEMDKEVLDKANAHQVVCSKLINLKYKDL